MIPSSQEILEKLSQPQYKPKTFDQLCQIFRIASYERKRFRRQIKNLQYDLKLIRTREKTYRVPSEKDFKTGRVQKHARGFGFFIPDDKTMKDVYLSPAEVQTIMNGDRVRIVCDEKGTGKLVEILERSKHKIVGKVVVKGKEAYVVPLGRNLSEVSSDWVQIPYAADLKKMKDRNVVCKITRYPEKNRFAQGKIEELLGLTGELKSDFSVMIHQYDLRHEFPGAVRELAQKLQQWNLEPEVAKRRDLRNLSFVTIDGETAKDFDDAVYIEKKSNGHFMLWVAIADVSFFVKQHSALDQEAYERATSVYFPGGVIPMLPESLSNDLCSLNPHEDKLTFTCQMEFDQKGNRRSYEIYESVIRSAERLTYTKVQEILDQQKEHPFIHEMNELKRILKKSRDERGCIDFDLPEPEILLDLEGNTETIVKRSRLEAHMIIEEFMIAANETVAEYMFKNDFDFVYRVHEVPDRLKLFQFHELLHNLGYKLKLHDHPHPKTYSDLLKHIEGKPEETLVNTVLLRSMKQARYAAENLKHFGLASECYTHFTSPIRRYPDLVVHRLLKERLKFSKETSDKKTWLSQCVEHCSRQERVVETAEREFISLKKAQFMMDKVGQIFVGFISGIQEFGLFVELEGFFVEGMVSVKSLKGDRYQFIEERYLLRGHRSGVEYHLGQKVKVMVKEVNLDRREVDFIFAE